MRIPIYEADYQVPTGLPVGPSRTMKAIGDLGETGQMLAQRIIDQEAQLREKKKRIGEENHLNKLDLDLTEEDEKIQDEEQRNPDPDNYFTNWQVKFRKAAKEKVEAIKDPELKARANNLALKFETGKIPGRKHYGNQLWLTTQQSEVTRMLEKYAARGNVEEGIKLIEKNKLGGIYTPTQADALIESFKKETEATIIDRQKAAVIAAVHSDNPESALPLIEESKFKESEKATLRELVKQEKEKARDKKEKESEEAARNNAYRRLKADYGDRHDVIFQRLADPNAQDEMGITLKQKFELEHIFESERRLQENQRREKHDKNFVSYFGRKDITVPQVDTMVRTEEISPEQGNFLKHDIQKVEPVRTDNSYWAKMFDSVMNGKNMRKDILWGGENQKLNSSDVQELYRLQAARETQGKEHFTSDPWFRLSDQKFREALGIAEIQMSPEEAIKKSLTGEMGPKASQRAKDDRYYNAITDLMRAVEKDKLSGEAIWKRAGEILKVYATQKPPQAEGLDKLPPAKDFQGIIFINLDTGERKKSNGKKWITLPPKQGS